MRNYTILITIVLITLLSSCSKEKVQGNVKGDWKQISVGHLPEETEYKWSFKDNDDLIISTTTETTLSVDTAEWDIEMRTGKKNLLIIKKLPLITGIDYNGKYVIHTADEVLKIQRIELENGKSDGSYLWIEFEKK